MKIVLSNISFMILLCLLQPSMADGKDFLAAIETWPPFRILEKGIENQYTGIDVDLLHEISRKLQVNIRIKRYPWARCLSMMKSGKADIIMGLAYSKDRADYIRYSKTAYFSVAPAFYVKKGRGNLVMTYSDLYKYTVGYSIDSVYFDRFDLDKEIDKHGVPSELSLMKMLVNNRLDVIIGIDANIEYDAVLLGVGGKIEKAYYRPAKSTDLYLGISQKSEFINYAEEVDSIVKNLTENGVIQNIAEKYIGPKAMK